MGVLTNLASIRKAVDERPKGFDNVRDRELTSAMKSGEKRKIRFLQELDPESKGYDEKYGTGLVVSELAHPDHFWLLVVDTTDDEGECWAADQGWKSKLNLYINVQDVETGDVFYIARSVLGGLGADILESASERSRLTDALWTIKKTGEGLTTRYSLTMVDISDDPVDVDPSELIDFRQSVLNEVESDKQAAFVAEIEERLAKKASENGKSAASDDDDDDVW